MPPGPRPALALDHVSLRYGRRSAVDDVTLAVAEGELFALLGPSGSGKTSVLRLIAGFEAPDAGTVTMGGRTVAGGGTWVEPERRGVGLVPQGDTLFPHLSVAGNVGFGVGGDRERVAEALELVGLGDRADSRPGELSGGERQRVALARALAPRPAIVLLDEPFSAIDGPLRARLRRDVVDILRRAGATGVLVTHDREEALGTADRLAVLRDGRLMQCGGPADLYRCPADAWTAAFLGDVNVLDAEVDARDGRWAQTPLGRLPVPARAGGGRCAVCIRPEQLLLRRGEAPDAVVAVQEFRGHDVMYEIDHPELGRLLVQLPSHELFAPGERVRVVPHERASAAVLADPA